MKHLLVLLIFLFQFYFGHAQNNRIIDSLKKYVQETTTAETKIPALYNLYESLRFRDSAESDNVITEGLALSQQANNISYQSLFSLAKYKIYSLFNNPVASKKYLEEGFAQAKNGNAKSQAIANLRMGEYYGDANNSDSNIYFYLKAEDFFKKADDCVLNVRLYQDFATTYSYKGLNDKQIFYAREGLATSEACKNPDAKLMAMFTMAVACADYYRADPVKNKEYDDSVLYFYKKVIAEARDNQNVSLYSTVADAYYNIGSNFYEKDEIKNADSTLFYFDKSLAARSSSEMISNNPTNALMQIVKARIFIQKKNYEEASNLLNFLPFSYPMLDDDAYLAIRYYEVKTMYAKATGNYKDALEQMRMQMEFSDKLYNQEKLSTVKRIETEFTNYKQQQELKSALGEISTRRRLNYLYIALFVLSLLGLVFMYRSYYFRQRNFIKEKALLEKEKEEAELQTRLKEEEAMNAIMEKELMDQDRQMALQDKILTEQQKENLQQELMSNRLQLEVKNNFLREIKDKLPSIQSAQQADIKNISRTVDKSFETDAEFELLQKSFENTNPRFFALLQEKSGSSLTQLDLKYCGYIKIGMSTKEIANLMNIEPKSMRMARYRIKQKLVLEKEQDLDSYIVGI